MAVSLPKSFTEINEELIYFQEPYKGKNYHNIRKVYEDKDGERCLGKGLCVSEEDWKDIKEFFAGEK